MSASDVGAPPTRPIFRGAAMLSVAALVLATFAVYSNSFSAAFELDDYATLVENASIRHWSDLAAVLSPPVQLPVSGRPLANLTFALNYAFGGTRVNGYHIVNLAIHICAALTLFGVVRRTLGRKGLGPTVALAAVTAALWALHPIQTAAVTYLSQRTEILMGLCYLLTLYAFIRGVETPSLAWLSLSVLACAFGMAAKEVMATAPLMVLLYDRTFVASSFGEALRLRWRYYISLGATWILLGGLIASGFGAGGVGYGLGVTWWGYALTQSQALVTYLMLACWPQPLIFDYGVTFVDSISSALPFALPLFALLTVTGFALFRRSSLGFLGGSFFLILAPTSSVVPLALQPISENRVYLPLASVMTLAVLAVYRLGGRRGLACLVIVACGLGCLTVTRNRTFQDARTIWADTLAKRPNNPRAYDNYALALCESGHADAAIPFLTRALELNPNSAPTNAMLGNAHLLLGHLQEAAPFFVQALRLNPNWATARINLGVVFLRTGHAPEAIEQFDYLLRSDPNNVDVLWHLGLAFDAKGDSNTAIAFYERALRIDPNHVGALNGSADLLAVAGHYEESVVRYEKSLQIKPAQVAVQVNLANALLQLGRLRDAAVHCEQALRLDDNYAEAHHSYGIALFRLGRGAEAVSQLEQALRINPNFSEARETLAKVRAAQSAPAAH